MNINILGTNYDFRETTEKDDPRLCGNSGYCDAYAKVIAVETDFNESAPHSIKDFGALKKKVRRHEIIHAFFFESGLYEFGENEQLVDWIAWHIPKMLEIFGQVQAL